MCLLCFCLFKTVLKGGRTEMQKNGSGCGGISCVNMSGIPWHGPAWNSVWLYHSWHSWTIFGSWGILVCPFPAPSIPADAIPAQCPSPAVLGEHPRMLPGNPAPKHHVKALNNLWARGAFIYMEMFRPWNTGCISALAQREWSHTLELNHCGRWW